MEVVGTLQKMGFGSSMHLQPATYKLGLVTMNPSLEKGTVLVAAVTEQHGHMGLYYSVCTRRSYCSLGIGPRCILVVTPNPKP